MKKFWKYFLITILLLVGLFCVGLLYLFFVPNSSLFGLTYISYKDKYETNAYHRNDVNTIVVNNNSYDVNIISTTSDNISALVHAKSFGYVLKKNSNVELTAKLNAGVLTIDLTEPSGACFKNNSYIEIRIPESEYANLVLKNKKATTTIDSETLTLDELSYTTSSGDFFFKNGKLNNLLNLNINKADFNISETAKITATPNVSIKTASGKLNAPHHSFNEVEVIENSSATINLKSCALFIELAKSAGGTINIERIENINIESSDTNVNVKNLGGGSIILTQSGKVDVEKTTGKCYIETNSGSIKVSQANAALTTVSDSGNQQISNATQIVEARSTYGDINISFSTLAGNYNPENPNAHRCLKATTKNGKITATGVDNVTIGVEENGTGRIDITMRKVLGTNLIQGRRGEVNIKVSNTAVYTLTTESTESGSVYVNVGQSAVNGYTTPERTTTLVNPYASGSHVVTGSLEVTTTSGSLSVIDEIVDSITE